jgi:hypothetical protein
MNLKILKNFTLTPLLKNQKDEVKRQLLLFQRKADIKIMSVNFKKIKSFRSKDQLIQEEVNYFLLDENIKYVAIDDDTGEIGCFFCFSVENKEANFKMALKNPEYVFNPLMIDIAKKVMDIVKRKYGIKRMYSRLYERNNFTNYKKFITKYLNGKLITDGEKRATVEYDI